MLGGGGRSGAKRAKATFYMKRCILKLGTIKKMVILGSGYGRNKERGFNLFGH